MSNYEKKIISFCEKNMGYIFAIIMTFIGIYVRYIMLPFMTSDYTCYYMEWYNQLKECGGVFGIAEYTGDYNYAYVFLLSLVTYIPLPSTISIKLFHILFDFVGAIIAGAIAKKVYSGGINTFALVYSATFVSPLVMLNSAHWGQCDFMYTSFVLLSIYMLLSQKYDWSFFVYGVALSIKLQAAFILPLFIFVYILNRNFSILKFLWIPIGFLVSSFPGMLFSKKGISGLIDIYSGQVQQEEILAQNYPNIYYWISSEHYDLYLKSGVLLLVIILGFASFYLVRKKAYLTENHIVAMGIWCVLCVVYFCPKMHERYSFVAEILSIIWVVGNKKWLWYPIIMGLTVLFSYFAVLYGYYLYNYQDMALVNIVTFIVFTMYLFSDIKAREEE